MGSYTPFLLTIGFQIILFSSAQEIARETIYSLSAFSVLDTCIQACFISSLGGCTSDILGSTLQCPGVSCTVSWAAPDSCYCRSDKQSVAQSYLSTCVLAACTAGDVQDDISSAESIYGYYCSSIGYTAGPASVSATTTAADNGATNTLYVTVYTATYVTSTATLPTAFGPTYIGLMAGTAVSVIWIWQMHPFS